MSAVKVGTAGVTVEQEAGGNLVVDHVYLDDHRLSIERADVPDLLVAIVKVMELEATAEGLRVALWEQVEALMAVTRYRRHHGWCAYRPEISPAAPCDCGLSSALEVAQVRLDQTKQASERLQGRGG